MRAVVYVRISSDPNGKGLGVARQEKACRERAASLGWDVVAVYTDNDVSASTGKRRPAYEAMLADLETGVAQAVIVWDLDRLTRRPIEIEHFIDLADRKKIALASIGGDVDLSTDNGRMFARIKGAVARAEVERKSARQRAANDQRAERGDPFTGRRPFGYRDGGRTVDEAEAQEFRTAVQDLLSGRSLRAIVRGMNDRGAVTTAGNPWRTTELRRLLLNPRHAGLRVHRGEIFGEGNWPPIIDVDTHRAVVAMLRDPSRHRAGRPRRYLLTGVARCGTCGGRIYGVTEPRGPLYYCETRRHVARRAEEIDDWVALAVIERLTRSDARTLFAPPDGGSEAEELRRHEHELRTRLDGLAAAFADGAIDARQLKEGSARLRPRLEAAAARLASLTTVPVLAPLVGAVDVEHAWDGLEVDQQRAVIEALLHVTIRSAGRGCRSFRPDSVELNWRHQEPPPPIGAAPGQGLGDRHE
ncbi:recombinase family protein [Intrasporangium sp. YIM S08009]|uniref:recombinase family protein n=1 Tax=Intrasporangium zincisolvens TaxID=3080018 RepID=UPI002B05F0EE|nr:recombinase family protein [Intrasporangium sp. YIM S08009]